MSGQPGCSAGELELAGPDGLLEEVQELSPEDPAQGRHVEQEIPPGGNPAVALAGQSPAWDQAVEMEVVAQRLIPGVEHGQQAGLGSQPFGIGQELLQSGGRAPHQ